MRDEAQQHRPADKLRFALESALEALKAACRPLIEDVAELETQLEEAKKRAELLARQGYGILLALGYDEAQAGKEIRTWRSPDTCESSR